MIDCIINFFADSDFLRSALGELERPYRVLSPHVANRKYKEFVQSAGNSVMGLWQQSGGAPEELGRVCVLGFSEGCSGVRAVLETTDASAIDTVFAIDGIHTQYADPFQKTLSLPMLKPWIAYAQMAGSAPPSSDPNVKLLCVTHSSIQPPGYASTTETAAVVYERTRDAAPSIEDARCGFDCPAAVAISALDAVKWPDAEFPMHAELGAGHITEQGWTTVRPQAPETNYLPAKAFSWGGLSDGWQAQRIVNNAYFLGWANHDPTGNRDHVFQAHVVCPYVVRQLLVPRWNPSCGLMGYGAEACTMGGGKGYHQQPKAPLPDPGGILPALPTHCPAPPPGYRIEPTGHDPCAFRLVAPAQVPAWAWGALAAGAVVGFGGVLWAAKSFR